MSMDEIISGLLRLSIFDDRYWWMANLFRSLYVSDRSAYNAVTEIIEVKHFKSIECFLNYVNSHKEVLECL